MSSRSVLWCGGKVSWYQGWVTGLQLLGMQECDMRWCVSQATLSEAQMASMQNLRRGLAGEQCWIVCCAQWQDGAAAHACGADVEHASTSCMLWQVLSTCNALAMCHSCP